MAKIQETPPRLRQNAQEAEFFEKIRTRTNVAAQATVASADASDLATAITLVNELKTVVNALIGKMETAGLVDS